MAASGEEHARAGRGYAWVSVKGEYVLSDEAGFNPNVGSTIEWRQLRVAG
jgi:hypothetical protein